MKNCLINIILLIILLLLNWFVSNHNYYFCLIYSSIIIFHAYYLFYLIKDGVINRSETYYFIITSLLLYLLTYFIICDPNPFSFFIFYYTFNPCFLKSIFIIVIHLSFLIRYNNCINSKERENISIKRNYVLVFNYFNDFMSFINSSRSSKKVIIGIMTFIILDIIVFLNRIKIWVYLNNKNKTLPNSYKKNTTFYITSNIVNMENIIESYIGEMKKLINYLGKNNVIISFVENGDSRDNTRKYLEDFQDYLNENEIMNKFYLTKEIEDPRMNYSSLKYTRLRIEYYAKLRNKCFEFLYEIKNIDYNNTIVLFFNDIIFTYEDIIYLLSTNNEDFDAVCGLDMIDNNFYDTWVSIDLDGNRVRGSFPFFSNKEGQDLVVYHEPVRVFSCWNGVIAFKASPLENKMIQFRHKFNYSLPKQKEILIKNYYESECTYFHIDMYSLGYSKKFINPDVRVTYKKERFYEANILLSLFWHYLNYFSHYFRNFLKKRNKYMSDYFEKNIRLESNLQNWYIENKNGIK